MCSCAHVNWPHANPAWSCALSLVWDCVCVYFFKITSVVCTFRTLFLFILISFFALLPRQFFIRLFFLIWIDLNAFALQTLLAIRDFSLPDVYPYLMLAMYTLFPETFLHFMLHPRFLKCCRTLLLFGAVSFKIGVLFLPFTLCHNVKILCHFFFFHFSCQQQHCFVDVYVSFFFSYSKRLCIFFLALTLGFLLVP